MKDSASPGPSCASISNKRRALLVVGLLVAAWCWFWLASAMGQPGPSRAGDAPTGLNAHASEGGLGSLVTPTALASSSLRVEAPANTIVLLVRDGAGNPVVDATVARCSAAGARNLSRSDRIGVTDSSGELSIPFGEAGGGDAGGLLAISARGLVPVALERPRAPGRYEVVLAAGSTLEMQCHDFAGRPLPRIRVAISMVFFPAAALAPARTEHSEPGSDAAATIRHGESDESGTIMFEGLLPGKYFIRAESQGYLLTATENNPVVIDVAVGIVRHVIVCGEICVAALRTNVPLTDILFYEITGSSAHIPAASAQEILDMRRREIEDRFPQCQAMVSLAKSGDASHRQATFRYSTLGYGELVHKVPFVSFESFVEPALLAAAEGPRPPAGEVCIRFESVHGVVRGKLRTTLKRNATDMNGIVCIQDETRTVPVGRYIVDTNDREMARAIEWPSFVEVREHGKAEAVLRIKQGLVPLTIDVEIPAILKGQFASVSIGAAGQKLRRGRTRVGSWLTWVPAGVYDVTVEAVGCNPTTTRVIVANEMPARMPLRLELSR